MSALRAWEVAPIPINTPKRPELRAIEGYKGVRETPLVKSPLKAKSAIGFLFICGTVLVTALVAVLVLNTNVINGSFELAKLQTQIRQIDQDIQDRREQLSRAEASLSDRALELGLIPAANPEPINITNYVAAITGEVIGGATARTGR